MNCPKCYRNNCEIVKEEYIKKKYSTRLGCLGFVLLRHPIGFLCGFCGKKKKEVIIHYCVCKECGRKWVEKFDAPVD